MENSGHSEHPEEDESGEEEHRNNSKKIHDSVKGNQKPQAGAESAFTRGEKVSGPDSKYILHAEYRNGHVFHCAEDGMEKSQWTEGLQEGDQYVGYNDNGDEVVEGAADAVALVADLNDVENLFFGGHRSLRILYLLCKIN